MENKPEIGGVVWLRNDPAPRTILDESVIDGKTHYTLSGIAKPVCACAIITDIETLVTFFRETAKANLLNLK